MTKQSSKRGFGSKFDTFHYEITKASKKDAQAFAEKIRSNGKNARVVKTAKGYAVYSRPKRISRTSDKEAREFFHID